MSNQPALTTTIATAKSELQERAARDIVEDYKDYRTSVLTDGGPEDKRKLVEMQIRLIGAEVDKKGDGFGSLPVFNFIIHRGDQPTEITPSARHEPAADVVDVEPIEPVQQLQLEEPTEPMVLTTTHPVPEQKLGQLLSDLEGLFGPDETGELQ